jgi:hypothetical protein
MGGWNQNGSCADWLGECEVYPFGSVRRRDSVNTATNLRVLSPRSWLVNNEVCAVNNVKVISLDFSSNIAGLQKLRM